MASADTADSGTGDRRKAAIAIGLMIAAVSLFTVLDSTAKFLVKSGYPVIQTVWARYFFHLLLVVATFPVAGWKNRLRSAKPMLQVFRTLVLVCGTIMFIAALRWLPLADAYTISYVSPLIVTLLAVTLLRERVGRSHWAAILVGLMGVAIVMRPGTASFQWAMLLPLGMAFTWALFQITTRIISQSDPPLVTLFYTGLVGSVATGVLLPFFWVSPILHDVPLFIALGTLGLLSHVLLVHAYRLTKASILAPFTYTQLPFAVLSGYLLFADLPAPHVLAGASLIIASAIFIFLKETRSNGRR